MNKETIVSLILALIIGYFFFYSRGLRHQALQEIENKDLTIMKLEQTIKVLRDSLTLDSVLVISKEIKVKGLRLYDDTKVDTIIVDFGSGQRGDRQWKRK